MHIQIPNRVVCPLDADSEAQLVFEGRIRDGRFGHLTEQPFRVWRCEPHRFSFLDPFPHLDHEEPSYREKVDGSSRIQEYFALHDSEQISHLESIKGLIKRGMTVADCGCGGGSMLDLLSKIAFRTHYAPFFIERCIIFTYGNEFGLVGKQAGFEVERIVFKFDECVTLAEREATHGA